MREKIRETVTRSQLFNQFEDVAGNVTYLSRADGFANYDEATAAPASDVMSDDLVAQYHLNSNFDYTTYINEDDEMPVTGADNGTDSGGFKRCGL